MQSKLFYDFKFLYLKVLNMELTCVLLVIGRKALPQRNVFSNRVKHTTKGQAHDF